MSGQVSVDDDTKEWSFIQEASRANGQRKAGGRHDYTRAKECSVQVRRGEGERGWEKWGGREGLVSYAAHSM